MAPSAQARHLDKRVRENDTANWPLPVGQGRVRYNSARRGCPRVGVPLRRSARSRCGRGIDEPRECAGVRRAVDAWAVGADEGRGLAAKRLGER